MFPSKIEKAGRIAKILAINLLLFPLNLQSSRRFLRHIYAFNPIDTSSSSPVKTRSVFDLFEDASRLDVALKNLRLQYGNMSYEEIYTVALIVKCMRLKTIFEFGTLDGTTTLQMAANSPDETRIYTLDLPSREVETTYPIGTSELDLDLPSVPSGIKFRDSPEAAKITQLYGDSAVFDYTPYYGQMDLILIDASHEYDYVKNDTGQAMKMLRKPGVILWHDYLRAPGVTRYVDEIAHHVPVYHLSETSLAMYRALGG